MGTLSYGGEHRNKLLTCVTPPPPSPTDNNYMPQLKFHAERMSFSTTPAERCRKQMHITAIINAILALVYFLLVLYLDDDQLHLSFVVMLVMQTTVMICGFLTVRMWIYT